MEPIDPEDPELVDVFDDRIERLWPLEYEWMFVAAVLRDAVTNFEVSGEASEEALRGSRCASLPVMSGRGRLSKGALQELER